MSSRGAQLPISVRLLLDHGGFRVKRSTLISFTAAVSLAACHDATAPEPTAMTSPRDASVNMAGVDSNAVFALDDAATRLLSNYVEGMERNSLQRALRALSAWSARGDRKAISAWRELALDALERLRAASDPASAPDLDAIALAIDAVPSLPGEREHKER